MRMFAGLACCAAIFLQSRGCDSTIVPPLSPMAPPPCGVSFAPGLDLGVQRFDPPTGGPIPDIRRVEWSLTGFCTEPNGTVRTTLSLSSLEQQDDHTLAGDLGAATLFSSHIERPGSFSLRLRGPVPSNLCITARVTLAGDAASPHMLSATARLPAASPLTIRLDRDRSGAIALFPDFRAMGGCVAH